LQTRCKEKHAKKNGEKGKEEKSNYIYHRSLIISFRITEATNSEVKE
jgi:hypothetical protein